MKVQNLREGNDTQSGRDHVRITKDVSMPPTDLDGDKASVEVWDTACQWESPPPFHCEMDVIYAKNVQTQCRIRPAARSVAVSTDPEIMLPMLLPGCQGPKPPRVAMSTVQKAVEPALHSKPVGEVQRSTQQGGVQKRRHRRRQPLQDYDRRGAWTAPPAGAWTWT